jgi:hypothetical protein
LNDDAITKLKEQATPKDLKQISEHKNKYLEFRKQTNKDNYLSLGFFFADLDRYAEKIFSYFLEDYIEKINKDFLKKIRLNLSIYYFNLTNTSTPKIVTEKLTHSYLKRNFDVDNSILKHYYRQTQYLISDNEFNYLKSKGYVSEKWKALEPYSIVIDNAYYSRSDLFSKLELIPTGTQKLKCGGKKVVYLSDLKPYFKEYSKGFDFGFKEFESECIKPYLTSFADKNDYVNKVFEFVSKRIFLKHDWGNLYKGFSTNHNLKTNEYEIIGGFKDGKEQGFFYRAWSIVFSNHILFTPLFKKIENTKTKPSQETPPPKESETLSNLITHQNSVEVVEKIKIQYKNIKGKSLKLLLKAFQDLDLLPKERIASKFHRACKNEFNWDIASYNAMNEYNFNDKTDKEDLEQKKSFLKSIIETK